MNSNHQKMGRDGAIIVIDDDVEDLELMDETFKFLNFSNEVKYFTNGIDALAYIRNVQRTPLIIISDVNMPRMDGYQIKKELNELSPVNANIPYIFLTTSAHPGSILNAFAVSAHGYFVKPTSPVSLRETVRTIVEYWRGSCSAA